MYITKYNAVQESITITKPLKLYIKTYYNIIYVMYKTQNGVVVYACRPWVI